MGERQRRSDGTLPGTETVFFNGKPYHRRPGKRYYSGRGQFLHRDVWRHSHGDIPPGCLIHHRDKNVENNLVSNLQCVTRKEHGQLHRDELRRTPEQMRPMHEAGARWWDTAPVHSYECAQCGRECQSKHPDPARLKFCGTVCSDRHRLGIKPRDCEVCGRQFWDRPSARTCSDLCSDRFWLGRCGWCQKQYEKQQQGQRFCCKRCRAFAVQAERRRLRSGS